MPKIKLIKKGKPLADAFGVDVYKQVGPGGKYQAYDAVGGKLLAEAEGISDLAHKLAAAQQDSAAGMANLKQAMDDLSTQFKKLSPGEHAVVMPAQKPEKHGKKLPHLSHFEEEAHQAYVKSKNPYVSDEEAYQAYLKDKKKQAKAQAKYYQQHYKDNQSYHDYYDHNTPSFEELLGTQTGHLPPKKVGKSPEKIKQEKDLEQQKLQQIADSAQSPEQPGTLNYSALEAKLSVASAMSNTNYTYTISGYPDLVQDQYGNIYKSPPAHPYKEAPLPPWSPGVSQHSVYQPAADASLTSCIFHAATPADNFKLCWNPKAQPLKNWPHPEHGTWVWCSSCNKAGIQPDPGFAMEFAPEGSHVNEKGEVVFHVGKEKAA